MCVSPTALISTGSTFTVAITLTRSTYVCLFSDKKIILSLGLFEPCEATLFWPSEHQKTTRLKSGKKNKKGGAQLGEWTAYCKEYDQQPSRRTCRSFETQIKKRIRLTWIQQTQPRCETSISTSWRKIRGCIISACVIHRSNFWPKQKANGSRSATTE